MKTSEILLLGGIGIAVWYLGFYKPSQLTQMQPSAPGGSLPQPLLNSATNGLQLQSSASLNPVAIPSPGANMTTANSTNPNATIAQQTTIFNWANTLNAADQAQFYASWPNMTASDVAGLMDLIVNEWQGGQPVTPARTAFWNSWRLTYKIDI